MGFNSAFEVLRRVCTEQFDLGGRNVKAREPF
jgi:hypothetical protein